MGSVGSAVTHAVNNVVSTVKTVVTNPTKANIGQIAAVVNPVTLTIPVDAAQHKEDRPILAAATAAAVAGAAIFGPHIAAGTSALALSGGGAASTLGLAKAAPAAVQAVETIASDSSGGGGPVPPPSSSGPPIFGPTGPGGGGDFGVWSTGDSGGGNVFANPVASGTTSPIPMTTTYLLIGAAFLLLSMPMLAKKGR